MSKSYGIQKGKPCNVIIITHLNRTDKVDEGTRKNLKLIEKISALKDHVGGGD